jgi:hypothetical protein
MTPNVALMAAAVAVFTAIPAFAQQPAETAEQIMIPPDDAPAQAELAAPSDAPRAADASAEAAKAEADAAASKKADSEALLRAQAAGYKLVTKDGKEVFCKKEMVTGSRLATRTRCLTLAQIEAERNATKDMLLDMSRKSVNIPQE